MENKKRSRKPRRTSSISTPRASQQAGGREGQVLLRFVVRIEDAHTPEFMRYGTKVTYRHHGWLRKKFIIARALPNATFYPSIEEAQADAFVLVTQNPELLGRVEVRRLTTNDAGSYRSVPL